MSNYEFSDDSFDTWNWLITEDTNVADSVCSYDRIIVDDSFNDLVVSAGVDSEGITKEFSDHYIVYMELEI